MVLLPISILERPCLSKAQKRNLRRYKNKNVKNCKISEHIHKTGYKFNTPIVRKLGLYKNSTKETIKSSFYDKRLSIEDNANSAICLIKDMKVGESFPEASKILEDSQFRNLLQNVLRRFNQIPLRKVLDGHCGAVVPDFVPGYQLYSFIRAIFHKCQIYSLVGDINKKALDRCVRRYLNSPRLMEMPLGIFVSKLSLKGISWLASYPHYLAQNAAAKLIKWVLCAFVENIVQAFFKATDVSQRNCKKKVFYYRKSVWSKLIEKGIDKLKMNNYVEINVEVYKKLQSSKIPPNISELRFLPKLNKCDVRPIARPSKQEFDAQSFVSMRKILQTIADTFPAKSDLSGKTLHSTWLQFVSKLGAGDRIYCVVADISDAFGSIKLTKLKPILEKYKTDENRAVLDVIIKRLFLHIVKFNEDGNWRRFLVKDGVLQGDIFSSLLSDIYYGYLTKQNLGTFLKDTQGMLLRGADDFIYLTTSPGLGRQFLTVIQNGFPRYGCKFSQAKTQTNVDDLSVDSFTYCGSIIKLSDRSICGNMSSYMNANMCYAQAWPYLNKPTGVWICNKFISLCGLKLSSLYFNKVNPVEACLKTLAANVYIALKRLTAMLDVLILSRSNKIQEKWLWQCLLKGFRIFQKVRIHTSISHSQVRYICLKSLIRECKSCVYPKSIIKGAKVSLVKCVVSNTVYLDDIVNAVPKVIPGVKSSADWK